MNCGSLVLVADISHIMQEAIYRSSPMARNRARRLHRDKWNLEEKKALKRQGQETLSCDMTLTIDDVRLQPAYYVCAEIAPQVKTADGTLVEKAGAEQHCLGR